MPEFKDDVRVYGGFQGSGRISPRVFGAKGDGSTDDTFAIQQAHDYCVNAGGGTVVLDGTFKITTTLTWYTNVNLTGVGSSGGFFGSASVLAIDHPTKGMFSLFGGNDHGAPTVFSNFKLDAFQNNTGTIFDLGESGGVQVVLDGLSMNPNTDGGSLKGQPIYATSLNTIVIVRSCCIGVASAVPAITVTGGARVIVSDSWFAPPGTSTTMVIEVRTGSFFQVTNSVFQGQFGGASGGVFIYTNTSGTTTATNNFFAGEATSGTLWYAFGWGSGANINATNNSYGDACTPVNYVSPPPILTDRKSRIDLLPGYRLTGLGNSYNALAGYEFIELTATGTSFLVNMPGKLFIGQRLRISVKNGQASSSWAPVFGGAGAPSNMAPIANLPGNVGGYGEYEFTVSESFGSGPSWVRIANGQ